MAKKRKEITADKESNTQTTGEATVELPVVSKDLTGKARFRLLMLEIGACMTTLGLVSSFYAMSPVGGWVYNSIPNQVRSAIVRLIPYDPFTTASVLCVGMFFVGLPLAVWAYSKILSDRSVFTSIKPDIIYHRHSMIAGWQLLILGAAAVLGMAAGIKEEHIPIYRGHVAVLDATTGDSAPPTNAKKGATPTPCDSGSPKKEKDGETASACDSDDSPPATCLRCQCIKPAPPKPEDVGLALILSGALSCVGVWFHVGISLRKKRKADSIRFDQETKERKRLPAATRRKLDETEPIRIPEFCFSGVWSTIIFRSGEAVLLTYAIFLWLWLHGEGNYGFVPVAALVVGMSIKIAESVIHEMVGRVMKAMQGPIDPTI